MPIYIAEVVWVRLSVAVLAVSLTAGLAACGGNDNVSQSELQQATEQAAATARQEERIKQLQKQLNEVREQGSSGSSSSSSSRSSCGADVSAGPNTSCEFALNVANAYFGSGLSDTVVVHSPVTGDDYTMHCTSGSPHTCTGGNDASVFFP